MPARGEEFRIGDYWLSKHSTSRYWQRTWYDARAKQTRRVSLGVEDLQDAKDKLTEWFLANHRPRDANPADMPLELVLARYYEEHAAKLPSREQAEIACGHLAAFFAGKMVGEVTLAEQERYVAFRRSRGAAIGTASRELSVLRAALRRAWKRGEMKSVPFIYEPEPDEARRQRAPKGRPLTMKEMAALFDVAAAPHGFMLLMILANTMCRPDAALDLTRFQRDEEHDLLDLNPPGRKQTKKYRPVVPITNTLRPWLDSVKTPYYVSIGRKRPRRIRSAKTFIREVRAAAGLDERVSLYSIRHTMARELRKRRVPAEQIELMLGHRRPDRTTQIYAPYDPDYCRDAARAIDAYFADLQKVAKRVLTGPAMVPARVSLV